MQRNFQLPQYRSDCIFAVFADFSNYIHFLLLLDFFHFSRKNLQANRFIQQNQNKKIIEKKEQHSESKTIIKSCST